MRPEPRPRFSPDHGKDVLYAEPAGAGWAAWHDSDGETHRVGRFPDEEALEHYARTHRYALVYVP